jgi:hypothetical protein
MLRTDFITGLIFLLANYVIVSGQCGKGKVLSSETNSALDYVNVVVCGKNTGTVSDKHGIFNLNLDQADDNDTLQFSMVGYECKSVCIRDFKNDTSKNIYLKPRYYALEDVAVVQCRPKMKGITLGIRTDQGLIRSGFAENALGSEMGIKIRARGRVRLKDLNLNVATCTFDSVSYRLNIYRAVNMNEYENILNEPIYLNFSKDEIRDFISFDLSRYSIVVEGDIIVALELYKDLGEGRLLFHTNFLNGSTHFRKTNDMSWAEASGSIGMFLHGQMLR